MLWWGIILYVRSSLSQAIRALINLIAERKNMKLSTFDINSEESFSDLYLKIAEILQMIYSE